MSTSPTDVVGRLDQVAEAIADARRQAGEIADWAKRIAGLASLGEDLADWAEALAGQLEALAGATGVIRDQYAEENGPARD